MIAAQLAEGDRTFAQWVNACGVELLILRPTMVYGRGRDLNVSQIARFIARFGLFPVVGAATGQRQPLHAKDLAIATHLTGKIYEVSVGETLSYYEMWVAFSMPSESDGCLYGCRCRFLVPQLTALGCYRNLAISLPP